MSIARWKTGLAMLLPGLLPMMAMGQQLTLRQAIDRALGKNPQVAIAEADVHAAQAGTAMARSALLPRLNAAEDISRGNDPVYVFGTKLRQQRFTQSDFSLDSLNRPTPTGDFATRLGGQWMLFNWYETQQQIHAAQLGTASATSMSAAARQGVMFQVVQAYQAVLYTERQLALARQQEQTAQALLANAETRVKAGLAIDSDRLGAQVNEAERQQETIAAEGAVRTAWAELENAMGGDEEVHPELKPLEARSYSAGNLADDVALALKTRPDLHALSQQSAAQGISLKAARSDLFPQVSAYGTWEMDRPTFAGDGGNNWVAGAQLNFDLLPFNKRAHLEQAKAAQEKAVAEELSQEQQIRLAVSRAFTGHETAERMVTTARAAMDQASESLRILRNRYDAGLATMTDLLRAEDAERQSQNDFWRAAYGNTAAYAGLLYATGQLTPDSAENLQ